MIYIIDTYAWIEYFKGSNQGSILKRLFENKNSRFITMECCIAELRGYCLKNNFEFNQLYSVVKKNSVILPVLREHWIKAAKIKWEMRKTRTHFGLIDAILVAKKEEMKCSVVSGDSHFKGLKSVVYVGN